MGQAQDVTGKVLANSILLFGMPRSGTTWLGQIFDSHPLTILRHEPDTVHPTQAFPFVLTTDELDAHHSEAREYLKQRLADRELRCVFSNQVFDKSFRPRSSQLLRRGLLYGAKSLDSLAAGKLERRLKIPDLVTHGKQRPIPVLKSVDSAARTPLFAKACPDYQFVYLIRHPCGVVSSKLRGAQLGKLSASRAFQAWSKFRLAQERGIGESEMADWSQLEISAWGWTLTNDFVLRASASLPNLHILSYDALCRDPITVTRDLFIRLGLGWPPQTASYLQACLNLEQTQKSSYYSTNHNPGAAAFRWRDELSEDDVASIMHVCSHSDACMRFLEDTQSLAPTA